MGTVQQQQQHIFIHPHAFRDTIEKKKMNTPKH